MPTYKFRLENGQTMTIKSDKELSDTELLEAQTGNKYADIIYNPNLSKEQKAEQIKSRGDAEIKELDSDLRKYKAKQYLGAALEIGSAAIPAGGGARIAAKVAPNLLKTILTNAPGLVASGAVSGTGRALVENKKNPSDFLKTAGGDTLTSLLGGSTLTTLGKGLEPIANKAVKIAPSVAEFFTSVPKKYGERALKAELQGKPILKGKFDAETAYHPIEQKIIEAKAQLPTKEDFSQKYKQLGLDAKKNFEKNLISKEKFGEYHGDLAQRALSGAEKTKFLAEQDIEKALNNLPKNTVNIEAIQNDIKGLVDSFARGGSVNPAKIQASDIIQQVYDQLGANIDTGLNKELKAIDLHNLKEILYDKANYDTTGGIRNNVAKALANNINQRLKLLSPEYAKANDKYALIKKIEYDLGGLNKNTFGNKLNNYGSAESYRTGLNDRLQKLDNILDVDDKFLDDLKKVHSAETEQNTLQELLGKSVFNDFSKYGKAGIETQNAFNTIAPKQVQAYQNLIEEEDTIKQILSKTGSSKYERNPALLSNVKDLSTQNALEELQLRSGINFMDDLENIKTKDAFSRIGTGQGGGSGSEEGIKNLVRTDLISDTGLIGRKNGILEKALAATVVSPRFGGQAIIKGTSGLKKVSDNLSRAYDKAFENSKLFGDYWSKRILPATINFIKPKEEQ